MKSYLNKLAVTLLVAVLPLASLKAEPGSAPGGAGAGSKTPADGTTQKQPGEKHRERGEEMKQALGLTDDQAAKIGEIMKADAEARKALKADTSLTKEDAHSKMEAMRKASDEKINALLTPEQVTKREALKAERKEKMKEKKDVKP